jgi:hypothetical protein
MTTTIVVAASVMVERSGPFWLAERLSADCRWRGHDHSRARASAGIHSPECVGSLIANAACALFALSYAALTQRHSLRLCSCLSDCDFCRRWFSRHRRDQARGVHWRRSCLARRCGDVLRDPRHRREQLDRLVFLRCVRLFSGGHGFILHHSASADRWASCRERRGPRAHPTCRAGAEPAHCPPVGDSGCGGPTQSACRSGLRGMHCFGLCVIGGCKKPFNAKGRVPAP